jgi:lipoate-protein ligase B
VTNDHMKLRNGWIVDLGQADYVRIWDLQKRLARLRYEDRIPDTLLLVEHEPVLTMGRWARKENVLASSLELAACGIAQYQVERGGDVTYHGPGQLVGYPIIQLAQRKLGVRTFVRLLEETLIRVLADFRVQAERNLQQRGVWVRKQKVAAIGVAVQRWVTFHGFALNVSPNLDHFCYINPCGLDSSGVTSMAALLGQAPSMAAVAEAVAARFSELFPAHWRQASPRELSQEVMAPGENSAALPTHGQQTR